MKTAKLGALFLISVLALAGIGAGYAAWTDTITIKGTVNTGDVDLDIVALSSTWVYKVPGCEPDELVVNHAFIPGIHATVDPNPPDNGILIASATADIVSLTDYANNIVTVTFDNLFPCIYFCVDVLWHYDGSIPVKINDIDFQLDQTSDPLIEDLFHGAIMVRADEKGCPITLDGTVIGNPDDPKYDRNEIVMTSPDIVIVDEGTQLHWCDYVYGVVSLHVPQDDIYMDLDGSATLTIEVVQWNEYPYTAP